MQYIADENGRGALFANIPNIISKRSPKTLFPTINLTGFQPQGSHLPVAPAGLPAPAAARLSVPAPVAPRPLAQAPIVVRPAAPAARPSNRGQGFQRRSG